MGKKKINKLFESLKLPTFWNWLMEWENAKKIICTILWLVAAPILTYYGIPTESVCCGIGIVVVVLACLSIADDAENKGFYLGLYGITILITVLAVVFRHQLQDLCQFTHYKIFLVDMFFGFIASLGMLIGAFFDWVSDHIWWI